MQKKKQENCETYTILPGAEIGNMTFKKVYILPNIFRTKQEMKKELPKLFNNCTVFTAKDSLWIVKTVLCFKVLAEIEKETGILGLVIHNDKAIPGNLVCKSCVDMVEFYLGECKKKNFMPLNKKKNTMFLKESFKTYKRIDEKKVLHNYMEMMYHEYTRQSAIHKNDKRTMDAIRTRCADQIGRIMWQLNDERIRIFDKEKNKATMYFDREVAK